MGGRILMSHDSPRYRQKWNRCGRNKYNGALYYSKEIVKNIIPRVSTDRTWITVNMPGVACNHSIVFVHNNLHPENYDWLTQYKDVVLVCGVPETCEKVAHIGKAIYLPLSIDVEEVGKYHCTKTKEAAFAGRPTKRTAQLPAGIDYLEGLPRREMLARMAEYKKIYAVGRTAIEAKALGCEVLPYDERYPDTSRWQVLDNREAADILQQKLDEIDKIKEPVIIDHNREDYKRARDRIGVHRWNGAYYYSREIVENIIPRVETDRNWITIKAGEEGRNHSVCFVHNNIAFEKSYAFMREFDDVVYVVGLPDMVDKASAFGETIYLPLSVDVEYVKQFRTKKTKDTAFVGRPDIRPRIKKEYGVELPAGIDFLEGLPREELLAEMAKYRKVYAIGRTAIEAKVLGCEVLSYHPRVPDPEMWQVLDNSEAAEILQRELDRIDHPERLEPEEEPEPVEMERPKRGATKAELVAYAGLCGVHITSRMTKAEILQKLSDAGRW